MRNAALAQEKLDQVSCGAAIRSSAYKTVVLGSHTSARQSTVDGCSLAINLDIEFFCSSARIRRLGDHLESIAPSARALPIHTYPIHHATMASTTRLIPVRLSWLNHPLGNAWTSTVQKKRPRIPSHKPSKNSEYLHLLWEVLEFA